MLRNCGVLDCLLPDFPTTHEGRFGLRNSSLKDLVTMLVLFARLGYALGLVLTQPKQYRATQYN